MTDNEFLAAMHIESSCPECPLHEAHIERLRDALSHAEHRQALLRRELSFALWVIAGSVMGWMIWWIGSGE